MSKFDSCEKNQNLPGGGNPRARGNPGHATHCHKHMPSQRREANIGYHSPTARARRCSVQTARAPSPSKYPPPRGDSKSMSKSRIRSVPHAMKTATHSKLRRPAASTLCAEYVERGSLRTSPTKQASKTEANPGRRCRPDREPVMADGYLLTDSVREKEFSSTVRTNVACRQRLASLLSLCGAPLSGKAHGPGAF